MANYRAKSFKSRRRAQRRPAPAVQLSKHDLAQLDDAALAALTPEQLHALSVKLLADLKLAHERLDRNPRNSSRPPSSMAPWDRASADADEPPSSGLNGESGGERESGAEPDATAAPAGDQASGGDEASAAPAPQGAPAGDTREQRRPGQRPGAPGHGRMQRLPIDHVMEHHPAHCQGSCASAT